MSDVYAAPAANLEIPRAEEKTYPGLSRLPYFAYSLLANAAYGIAASVFGVEADALNGAMPAIVLMIVVVIVSVFLVVKRLQNLGSSGWWALAIFVPILNLWIGIKAMAFPEGYDDHRTLDRTAKIILGALLVCLLLVIGMVLMVVSNA